MTSVARSQWFDREQQKNIQGNVFLWELKIGKQEWYIYRDHYRWWSDFYEFPYQGVKDNCKVYRIGHFHIWKGTYKD